MANLQLTERQEKRIKDASLYESEEAYRKLCSEEVELKERLELVRDLKARILIEIDIKINERKQ